MKKKINNSILLDNLKFFGEQYAPSNHTAGTYHQGAVCQFLAINESNLSNWKRNIKPIARTTIKRMADKLSQYFTVHITPEQLVSRSLCDVIDIANFKPSLSNSNNNNNGLDEKIQFLLGKYPEQKQPILIQLELYDQK